MKLFVAVALSATLFLTACSEKNDSVSSAPTSVTIPEGTPVPPGGFGNADEMQCGTNSRTYGEDDVESAQICKRKLGKKVCEQYFTKAACDVPSEE